MEDKSADIARRYTELMIACAKDKELRETLLDPKNQAAIHGVLTTGTDDYEGVGMTIPEDAYVVFDERDNFSQCFLSKEKEDVVITEKLLAVEVIEQKNNEVKSYKKREGTTINMPLPDPSSGYKKMIVVPLLVISDFSVSFNGSEKAEIVLSTC